MHPELSQLDRLDTLDRETWRRETKIHQLETELAEAQALKASREAALEEARAAQKVSREAQKAVQRQLDKYRNNRDSAIRLLETGQGDPEAAQRQVDKCEALGDQAETEVLELMEARDTLDATEEGAVETLAMVAQTLAGLEQSVPEAVSGLRAELSDLRGERDQLVGEMPREVSSRYEGWRARRKWAVARIVRGACASCRMEVQAQHLVDLKRGLITPCRGCHRWLIPPED